MPPNEMDKEIVSLCEAMNQFPGISTHESCCGHGDNPVRVWFNAESLDALPSLLYHFAGCHCGFYGWSVVAKTDCGMSPVCFMVEGPTGAYKEADQIAELLREYIAEEPADDASNNAE